MFRSYQGFRPYVPVAQRRRKAAAEAAKSKKAGRAWEPVSFEGNIIARTFWGKAWCAHLESHSDYENRLPRGRSYLRNGSVVHLSIQPGEIEALVSGTSLYKLTIKIKPLPPEKWQALCRECAGEIGSLVDLLQGKLSARIMSVMTHGERGLFPRPAEIDLGCSCPDSAQMCKHVAAVLYGVGARLDTRPELLFTLRSVDKNHLIAQATSATQFAGPDRPPGEADLTDSEVSALFGIEIDTTSAGSPPPETSSAKRLRPVVPSSGTPAKKAATKPKTARLKASVKKRKPAKREKAGRSQPIKTRKKSEAAQASRGAPTKIRKGA